MRKGKSMHEELKMINWPPALKEACHDPHPAGYVAGSISGTTFYFNRSERINDDWVLLISEKGESTDSVRIRNVEMRISLIGWVARNIKFQIRGIEAMKPQNTAK
jgi:hypothetical protein